MPPIRYRAALNKHAFELDAWFNNQVICGIDEVGRGCLAGPVVAAAVILHPYATHPLLRDSKTLKKHELLNAYKWIKQNSYGYAIGIVNHRDIDTYNIYQATLRAMRRAVLQLYASISIKPHKVLVDAMPLNLNESYFEDIEIYYFPFGEQYSLSIAAASIIAKVTRDTLMNNTSHYFPAYSLNKHKGYGTLIHRNALKEMGKSIIHRSTYIDNKEWMKK